MNQSAIKQILIILLFFILGLLIYSNTYESPFYFDGLKRIQNNPHLRLKELNFKDIKAASINEHSSSRRPVANLSFALNYYFHQYRLAGYHVVNIAIHILTGIFLYLFLKITMISHGCAMWGAGYKKSSDIENIWNLEKNKPYSGFSMVAFFSSLIWFVHPLHTQSVTYIVQRMNSMAAMFFILSFYLYVKGRIIQKKNSIPVSQGKGLKEQSLFSSNLHHLWFFGSVITWILALGSKQTAATLPFFIFLYEWYFFQNLNKSWIKKRLKYILAIFILFSVIALIYLGASPFERLASITDYANKEFTLGERLLTQPRVIIYYLTLLFYPKASRLNIDYDFPLSFSLIDPLTTIPSLLLIAALFVTAIFLAKRERIISFSILWLLGNLVIESVIPLAIIFEHRTYMPSMLIFLVPVILVYRYVKFKRLRFIALCVVAVLFSLWTHERNKIWRDPVSFWSDCVEKSSGKARPHNNLANALSSNGRIEDAIAHHYRSVSIDPESYQAHNDFGVTLEKQGRFENAYEHYAKALQINPVFPLTYINMGIILKKLGREGSFEHFLEALKLDPYNAKIHYHLGVYYAGRGTLKKAFDHYSKALQFNHNYADAYYGLGRAYGLQGDINNAISHYLRALEVKPDFFEAHNNLGISFVSQGKFKQAIKHYTEAIRIDPEIAEAYNNLGIALAQQGNIDKAVVSFLKALEIRPDYENARQNLKIVRQTIR